MTLTLRCYYKGLLLFYIIILPLNTYIYYLIKYRSIIAASFFTSLLVVYASYLCSLSSMVDSSLINIGGNLWCIEFSHIQQHYRASLPWSMITCWYLGGCIGEELSTPAEAWSTLHILVYVLIQAKSTRILLRLYSKKYFLLCAVCRCLKSARFCSVESTSLKIFPVPSRLWKWLTCWTPCTQHLTLSWKTTADATRSAITSAYSPYGYM